MACPVPHKPRDQVWLTVGLAAGCMIGYYYGSRKRSTTITIGTRPKQTIGFIGCGTISSAIVTGLCTLLPADRPSKIVLSPRNSEKAAALASQFPNIVTVASTNQEVVNLSDVVFLAVIPQIAKKVLSTLTFQKKHTIISVISALSINDLVPLVQPVPSTQICRAIPLPAVAVHKGSTIVTSHPDAERIFNLLGTAVIARNSKEFEVLMCISCMMGPFYKTCGVLSNWFVDNGIEPKTASSLTIAFHHTVLSEAEHRVESVKSPAAFNELVSEQTPGGLNEANVNDMTGAGTFDEYTKALNTTLKRLRGEVELTKVEE